MPRRLSKVWCALATQGCQHFFPKPHAPPSRTKARPLPKLLVHLTLSAYAAPHPISPTLQLLPGRCEKHLAGHRAAALFMAKASAKIGCLSQQRRHPSAFCCSRVLSQPLPYPPFHLLLPSPSLTHLLLSLPYTHTAQRIAPFSRALRSHVHASVPAHQPDPSHKNSHINQLQSLHPIINHHHHHRFHLFTFPSSLHPSPLS